MEVLVATDDHGDRRGHGLLVVAFIQRRAQFGLGLGRFDEHEARRRGVGLGRTELQQVVQLAQRVVTDLATKGVVGARGAEQLVKRGIVQHI